MIGQEAQNGEERFDPNLTNHVLTDLKIRVRSVGDRKFPLQPAWINFINMFKGVRQLNFSGVGFEDDPSKSIMLKDVVEN